MVFSAKLATRYGELKHEQPGCLLLMQVGSFMQVMNEDARAVSDVTGLKLKMAGDVDSPVVVGGFPKSGLDAYVGKLVRAGHSVAIALQDEAKDRSICEIVRLEVERPASRDWGWTVGCEGPDGGLVNEMAASTDNARPQRKRPVHMPPVERHNESVILFVTLGTQPRVPAFANGRFHGAFVSGCGDADAWHVGKYMVMPDHIHLFCGPASRLQVGIKRWASYLKRRVTFRLAETLDRGSRGRSPSTGQDRSSGGRASPRAADLGWKWQSDCWDTQIRSGEHYHEKWEYVRLNPVRKELVEEPDDWPWQGELNVLRW